MEEEKKVSEETVVNTNPLISNNECVIKETAKTGTID